jgi:DnaJ-class molecular chaperone
MTAARIEFYRSHLGGNPCARCTGCGSTYVYWHDREDLAHACWIICPQCDGEGESVPIWDEDTRTTARQICSGCSGNGSVRQMVEV